MTTGLICQTVTATTMAELRARRDEATAADVVELRLDGVADPDVDGALAGRRVPVVVTCRPTWEGGRFRGSEPERRRLLEQAIAAGAEYVDVEWRARFDSLVSARGGRGIILSLHDFQGVPADLPALYRDMRATGAEVVKVAVTARRLCDAFALEDAVGVSACRDQAAAQRSLFIAMGASGLVTRIRPGRFASRWTYAGSEAPGQISASRLLAEFRVREVSASAAVYGVVGSHASRSLSPRLHNAAFAGAAVDAVYLPLETSDYDDFLAFAGRLPLSGASVTMPFKEIAMRRADEVDHAARSVGAVNTLKRRGTTWQATNTDVDGFLDPIHDLPLRGRRVAILGAGGAARAVAVAVADRGASVTVYGRTIERALGVAVLVGGDASDGLPDPGTWDVLVNTTPVGSVAIPDRTPVPAELLRADAAAPGERLVYDVVYDPAETPLMRDARAAGCRTIGGFEMLAAQARRQREWWLR